jgi:hypothetical protein
MMLRSESKGDFVLRLLDGRSERREVAFTRGAALAPFAVGSEAAWSVSAGRVARAHVMLAFNGACLFACALPGELALLDGAPLDGRWTEVPTPSELRFGGARISIGRRAGPDELTEVPSEATRIEEPTAIANLAQVGAGRAEEVTCFDEERLQVALRLSASASGGTSIPASADVTCIAAVGVPAAAKGPTNDEITTPPSPPPPAPRPVAATVRIAKKTVLAATAAAAAAARPELRDAQTPSAKMTARLLAGLDADSGVPSAEITMLEALREPARSEAPSDFGSGVPSSMPPTIPSDGLLVAAAPAWGSPFPAAAARPSSPTIAIALPLPAPLPQPFPQSAGYPAVEEDPRTPPPYALDSLRARAVSSAGPSMRAIAKESPSLGQRKLGELAMGWKQASLPKKAIAILMLPALLGALLTLRPAASARAASGVVASASASDGALESAPAQPSASAHAASPGSVSPSATTGPAASAPAASAALARAPSAPGATASAAATAPAAPAEAMPSKATAAGLRETRSAERRALDTVASGLDASAAEQYAALAAAHPDNLAFSEASRILRARAATRHD